jgi:hypothetical protein
MGMKYLLAGAAMAVCMAGAGAASAGHVYYIGDDSAGLNVDLFAAATGVGAFGYNVASDGESPFDPYDAGYDTSDGLSFDNVGHVWTQAADSNWNFVRAQTWVLPANLGACGSENEPHCEPVGHFVSPDAWVNNVLGTYVITDSEGISDVIKVYNVNGIANLKFSSDPSLLGVPEPTTWAMTIVGFFGLGSMLRRRKAVVA